MMLKKPILLGFLIFSSINLIAQKIKYKDIFPQLESKQYEQVEGLMRQYMQEKSSQNEGSANFQMGKMLDYFSTLASVVNDSSQLLNLADSAIYFYSKAKSIIDEKELRSNDKYYQEFKRRDLRTGDFGVKLSDVQLEIDSRITAMKKRSENTRTIALELALISSQYIKAQTSYATIIRGFNSYSDLIVSLDESKLNQLDQLIRTMDMIDNSQKKVINAVIKIDNSGFRVVTTKRTIDKFGEDGISSSDVYSGIHNFWDYKSWATSTKKLYTDKYAPLITKMSKLNIEMGKLLKNVESGVLLSSSDLSLLNSVGELKSLEELDPLSIPLNWLYWIKSLTEYKYLASEKIFPQLLDSSQIDFQFQRSDTLLQITKRMATELRNIEKVLVLAEKKYSTFIHEFGGLTKFKEAFSSAMYLQATMNHDASTRYDSWMSKYRWGIFEKDSIDLMNMHVSFEENIKYSKYVVMDKKEDNDGQLFAFGIVNEKSGIAGFLAEFNAIKECVWLQKFKLMPNLVQLVNKSFDVSFLDGQQDKIMFSYYLKNEVKGDNFKIVNFTTGGTLDWEKSFSMQKYPYRISFNKLLGETLILLYDEAKLTSLGSSEKGYYVIDRNGNVR